MAFVPTVEFEPRVSRSDALVISRGGHHRLLRAAQSLAAMSTSARTFGAAKESALVLLEALRKLGNPEAVLEGLAQEEKVRFMRRGM